jgi:hypothetical protein
MGAVMMVLGSSPAGGSQILLETDFTDSVPVHRSSLGDFEGVLPPGCVPAFGWNQSVVTSELRHEKGQGFLRVTPKAMDGWVQFGWDLKLRVPGLARATVTYRTPSGELKMIFTQGWDHYRYEIQQGKPGEWNTLTLLCHLDGAAAQQVKHYFLPGLEGLDLAYLKVESFTPEEETALLTADAKGQPAGQARCTWTRCRSGRGLPTGPTSRRASARWRLDCRAARPRTSAFSTPTSRRTWPTA